MALLLPEVEIHEPESIPEACRLLKKLGRSGRVLAGGTDIIVDLKERRAKAKHLVSLSGIKELTVIKKDGKALSIGALVTANDIAESRPVKRHLPALAEAAGTMASYHIRNLATIGGNIVSAVPSADLPPILIAAQASAELRGAKGKRRVKLAEFFKGPRKTCMKAGEILTRIIIPAQPAKTGSSYQKFALRNATALAVAGAAARISIKNRLIHDPVVVLGAVAPTPMLAKKAMAILQDEKPSPMLLKEAGIAAAKEARPISDIRGSEEYRRDLVEVLTARAIYDAVMRATGNKF
ncbi:MAG: FAD binding domain-containing protein [Planctomycetota bacterium]|jgi:carbon-monoxide dehydrogenase medium subunit